MHDCAALLLLRRHAVHDIAHSSISFFQEEIAQGQEAMKGSVGAHAQQEHSFNLRSQDKAVVGNVSGAAIILGVFDTRLETERAPPLMKVITAGDQACVAATLGTRASFL